jgi:hemerythrin-like domain-containing protein
MTGGPTQMMRFEHAQMRDLIEQMERALNGRDGSGFAGAAETLLILMQQHNMKEENILYPMCDRSLATQADALGVVLRERLEAACPTAN